VELKHKISGVERSENKEYLHEGGRLGLMGRVFEDEDIMERKLGQLETNENA